ncbi:ComEA family DNA-binding protein [Actinocrinis puniceicyclus]|uniref:ComEA family DNA-binding protein n=1 Tax=Actinocrinis puniceicyclus TaxID=977794 RepID=A0A8J7WIJ9_9ACTN|nr:ComEA family DNA-binding protein [Actinocrinis puniceicyclus]MBS2961968.1 ComEA family DNA-binding protein [Actinocrinis puniceicyclus]
MSGSERPGFTHYEFDGTARAVGVEPAAAPVRRPGRLDQLAQRINDRLPVTLRGRWRLDWRSGTALAAAVALAAVVFGGWTLFRARSQAVARPQLFAAGHKAHRSAAAWERTGAARPDPGLDPPGTDTTGTEAAGVDSGIDPGSGYAGSAVPLDTAGPLPAAAGYPGSAAIGTVVVDVEGKVARPGVFHLPAGSRVMDALRAAGGALPGTDLAPLNQARILNDGEQVLVGAAPGLEGAAGLPPASARAGGRGKAPLTGPVHLNTATAQQLEQLPGVGPALAQRILDYRAEHGPFTSIAELRQVHGLGPSKLAALRRWVTP